MTPVPVPPAPAPVTDHPDFPLVRKYWLAYRTHEPGLTWPAFIDKLRSRLAFFREERIDREAKLAALQTTRGPHEP